MKKAAAEYEITLQADSEDKLTLETEPLLRWTNPVRGTTDGAIFAWTLRGCPHVFAGIYRWHSDPGRPDMEHEFTTLSQVPITATRLGQTAWTPRVDVERRPIAAAPAPNDNVAVRLRQMRALAREFTASYDKPNGSELRMLPQPIFRYASTRPDLLDGAIFAFVEGTDPEVLLALEARAVDVGFKWTYAFARMTSVPLCGRHDGQEVWKVPDCWQKVTDRYEPYSAFFRLQLGH